MDVLEMQISCIFNHMKLASEKLIVNLSFNTKLKSETLSDKDPDKQSLEDISAWIWWLIIT